MTTNQKISVVLLIGRLVTVMIMSFVIRKQWRALKSRKYPELRSLRQVLLIGSLVVSMGNILPIIIDVYGIFGKGSFGLLLAYVFSNNITAILAAVVTFYSLSLAERIKVIDDHEE